LLDEGLEWEAPMLALLCFFPLLFSGKAYCLIGCKGINYVSMAGIKNLVEVTN